MRESEIEKKLTMLVREKGGLSLKFVSPGSRGVPDRILLFPGGRVAFVEVKAPGKKLRPLQQVWRQSLKGLGFDVYVLDNSEQIEVVLNEIYGA